MILSSFITLILWFGDKPEYFGQYQTDNQCWQMVHKLLEHGIGTETGVKFQCYDAANDKEKP